MIKNIYEYIEIKDQYKCSICYEVFNNDTFLIITACDCANRKFEENEENEEIKEYCIMNCNNGCYYCKYNKLRLGFHKFCGHKENPHNMFHYECFENIAETQDYILN